MNNKMIRRKIIAMVLLGAVAITWCPTSSQAKKAASVDLNGKYEARIGIQTADVAWINRFGYFDKKINEDYKKPTDNKLLSKSGETKDQEYQATINDTKIEGNGTYTVSITDADFGGEKTISQLHVATNIPLNDTIKFSDVSVTIDGEDVVSFDEAVLEDEEKYQAGYMDILLFNSWRPELCDALASKGRVVDATNGWTLLQGRGAESVEITFTVSGFAYDNPEAVVQETQTPESTDVAVPASTGEDNTSIGLGVGIAVVVGVVVIAGIAVIVRVRKSRKHNIAIKGRSKYYF